MSRIEKTNGKKYLALSLLLFAILFPTSSFAFEIGAYGYYWFPSLDGNVKVDKASIIGSTIDFEKDLGIKDEYYPSVGVFLWYDRHHLSLMYTSIRYFGHNTLSRPITFNGQTYNAANPVDSSIEYKTLDLHYQYDFLDLENVLAGFSLGAVLQVKYLNGEIGLKTTRDNAIDERENFIFHLPMVGLNLHIGILADIPEARLRGTTIGYSGNAIYELNAYISLTPLPFLDIHGGYKSFVLDINEDDVILEYDMSGPYVALTVSF